MLDKRTVLKALIQEMEKNLAVMIEAAKIAHAAATHEEMKPENDKDTRGLEAGYLARGQSARAAEIEATVKQLKTFALTVRAQDVVDVGAVVVTEDTDSEARAHVFIAPPGAGGVKLKVGGVDVHVVTLTSPMGEALEGKCQGDFVELSAGGKKRELEIVSVT